MATCKKGVEDSKRDRCLDKREEHTQEKKLLGKINESCGAGRV